MDLEFIDLGNHYVYLKLGSTLYMCEIRVEKTALLKQRVQEALGLGHYTGLDLDCERSTFNSKRVIHWFRVMIAGYPFRSFAQEDRNAAFEAAQQFRDLVRKYAYEQVSNSRI